MKEKKWEKESERAKSHHNRISLNQKPAKTVIFKWKSKFERDDDGRNKVGNKPDKRLKKTETTFRDVL